MTLPPGPLTDVVGSAAVIAMRELLKWAVVLLAHETDLEAVNAPPSGGGRPKRLQFLQAIVHALSATRG